MDGKRKEPMMEDSAPGRSRNLRQKAVDVVKDFWEALLTTTNERGTQWDMEKCLCDVLHAIEFNLSIALQTLYQKEDDEKPEKEGLDMLITLECMGLMAWIHAQATCLSREVAPKVKEVATSIASLALLQIKEHKPDINLIVVAEQISNNNDDELAMDNAKDIVVKVMGELGYDDA